MGTREIVVIVVLTILGVLFLIRIASRREARERQRIEAYALTRGYALLKSDHERLARLLRDVAPKAVWRPRTAMLVDPPPRDVYFFATLMKQRAGRENFSEAFACLAEHSRGPAHLVNIFSRVPGLDFLVPGRVDAGAKEFQREFSVVSEDAASAQAVLTPGVERILLDHDLNPGWFIDVYLSQTGIAVRSFWTMKSEDWDHLIALTKKLSAAL